MRAIVSKAAEADLQEVTDFIAAANPVAADHWHSAMLRKFKAIANQPMIYPSRDEISPGLRVCPVDAYNIYFRVDQREVFFVRVLHSARDVARQGF